MSDVRNTVTPSRKRFSDTPFQDERPSKVRKRDTVTGDEDCAPRRSSRVVARANKQFLPSASAKRLVFSHVEVPVRPRPANQPSAITSLLTDSYGPPIGDFSSFISRCNEHTKADANGQCQVLTFFGIFTFRKMLLCTLHGYDFHAIPLSLLDRHLDRQHKFSAHRWKKGDSDSTVKSTRRVILLEIVRHVSECCALPLSQSSQDLNRHLDVTELLMPHPDLSSATQPPNTKVTMEGQIKAEERFLCPQTSCDALITRTTRKGSDRAELIRHVKESHQADTKLLSEARTGKVAVRWTQRIYIATAGSSVCFTFLLLPSDWRPANGAPSDTPSTTSIFSRTRFIDIAWVKQTKWDSYRAGLGRFSPSKLSDLIAPPALRLVPTESGEHRAIELGLYHLKKVALAYMLEFHLIVTTIPEMRELVASKLRSRYKINSKLSYYKPCSILVSTVALMLRYLHLSKMPRRKPLWMGTFELQCSQDQETASKNLYDLFVDSGGSPNTQDLQKSFHTLCVSLLRSCSSTDAVIACPTDQLLFIYGVTSGEGWHNPAELYHRCGSLQVAFQAIFIQMARLSAGCPTTYTPWVTVTDIEQSEDVDLDIVFPDEIPDDGLRLEDQSEVLSIPEYYEGTGLICGDGADHHQEILQPPQAFNFKALRTPIITSFATKHIALIEPRTTAGVMNPFSRLKTLGSILYKSAQTAMHVTITNVGRDIKVTYQNGVSIGINLDKWSHGTIMGLLKLQKSISALCPPGFSLQSFPSDRLRDDFGRGALFKQKHNAEWLDPLRRSMWTILIQHLQLLKDGKVQVDACQQWLEKEQAVLSALAVVFCLTCGISPGQHEFQIYFDSTSTQLRDVWLSYNGQIVWVNHKARVARPSAVKDITPAVFSLPTAVTSILMFYLNILRPISCKILRLLARDDAVHSTEIWSHYRHHTDGSYYWSGTEISDPIVKHTKEILDESLTPAEIRLIVRPILRHYCSSLVMQTMDSIIDKTAQHTSRTSLNNYGRISTFPPLPHLPFYHPEQSVTLSNIWHSLLGLGPAEEGWGIHMKTLGLLSHHALLGQGLHYSREAIKAYGQLSDPELIKEILKAQPFIRGSRDVFGDAVLVQVTRSILQDIQCQGLRGNQCITHNVVAAISLIVRGLNERITGSFVNLTVLDIDSLSHYSRIHSHFTNVVATFKEKHPDEWEAFIKEVLCADS